MNALKNTDVPASIRFHLDRIATARAERSLFFATYGYERGKAELDALDRHPCAGHVTEFERCESFAFLDMVRVKVAPERWAAVLEYRRNQAA